MNFNTIFPSGDDSIIIPDVNTKVIICAFDAEWLSNYTQFENLILSYQFSSIDLSNGNRADIIYYANYIEKERLSLTGVLEQIALSLGLKLSALKHYLIVLIAHNAVAEWSTLSNRNKLAPKLQFIRKTVITPNMTGVKLKIYDRSRNPIHTKFMLKDTMLLVPDKYRSLKKASELVDPDFAKLDIGSDNLSNMLKFLQEDPMGFEAYALRDTQVTLKLWITLQCMFNDINKSDSKIYSTLSSAALNNYISSYGTTKKDKEFFHGIFRRRA